MKEGSAEESSSTVPHLGSSEDERKRSHLMAEKKRREAIRRGFDRITAIVPGLDQRQSRSEVHVLDATYNLIINQLREHEALQALKDREKATSSNDRGSQEFHSESTSSFPESAVPVHQAEPGT